ncbi:MAG: four helix bundle protein [Gammaproteobacteria bacterium]
MAVDRFEKLVAWQKARVLNREVYRITGKQPFAKDFALRDQIRRSSVSAMANIAEGFDRAGRREFHQFLVIAKGSCAEVRSHLYAARDAGYLDDAEFSNLYDLADEASRLINALRATVAPRNAIAEYAADYELEEPVK